MAVSPRWPCRRRRPTRSAPSWPDRRCDQGVAGTSRSPGTCRRREVSAALHACDLAAFPFTAGATTKSGALLSAFAHRLPTVVTAAEPPDPELADGGTVVVAARVRSADALVEAISRLLDDAGTAGPGGGRRRRAGRRAQLAPDRRGAPHPLPRDARRVRPRSAWRRAACERYRDILVVDLLGGLGDLVMVLPVVHALARRTRAQRCDCSPTRRATRWSAPIRRSPRSAGPERGAERAAVRAELDRRRPRPGGQHHPLRRHRRRDRVPRRALRDRPVAATAARRAGDRPLPADPRRRGPRSTRSRDRPAGDPPHRCRAPGRRRRAGRPVAARPAGRADPRRPAWRSSGGRTGAAAGRRAGGPGPSAAGRHRAGPGVAAYRRRAGPCRPPTCAVSPRCSPRSGAAAAPWSARTPVRCGWPRRSARAPSGCSDRPRRPLRAAPARGRPAGPAGLPAPPTHRDHRTGLLVGGRAARCPPPVRSAWPTSVRRRC